MKPSLLYASVLFTVLTTACGQKDNVTPYAQPSAPGTSPQPKVPTGEPQVSPRGGNAVSPGNAPVTPGGAPAPGEGETPDKATGTAPAHRSQR
jgi:hypothetical protein